MLKKNYVHQLPFFIYSIVQLFLDLQVELKKNIHVFGEGELFMINFNKTNWIKPYIYLFCFKVLFQQTILNHANGIKLWHIHIHT